MHARWNISIKSWIWIEFAGNSRPDIGNDYCPLLLGTSFKGIHKLGVGSTLRFFLIDEHNPA